MEIRDTANLLAKAALVDNRQVSAQVVAAWHEAIGHHHYPDALAALDYHRQTSREYLVPAHINDLVPLIRRNREAIQNHARALTAAPPSPVQPPPPWFWDRAGINRDNRPPNIKCPHCNAAPLQPCTIPNVGRRLPKPHPSRIQALALAGASLLPEEG